MQLPAFSSARKCWVPHHWIRTLLFFKKHAQRFRQRTWSCTWNHMLDTRWDEQKWWLETEQWHLDQICCPDQCMIWNRPATGALHEGKSQTETWNRGRQKESQAPSQCWQSRHHHMLVALLQRVTRLQWWRTNTPNSGLLHPLKAIVDLPLPS